MLQENLQMRQKKKTKKKVAFSIRSKILVLLSLATLPFLVICVYLLVTIAGYNRTYNDIVDNLTIANSYNISFKEEMDESLYKIVVGYVSIDTIGQDETLKNPYSLIKSLRTSCTQLKEMTTDYESWLWLDSLLRNSDTLEKRVTDIVKNVHEGNQYDSNIKELDNNIYILTELIQDDIQYYIYYQTNHMETVTNELNAQVHTFLILLSVLIAVLGVVVAIAAFAVTSGILRPLWQLYDATGEIAEGNFAVRTNAKTSDEIAVLSQGFNEMADNMQLLVDKVRDDEQKMRKADLRLLQEQINPHFLYNTLDTIVWLIECNEADQAVDMVVTLSNFFRIVLSKGKEFISIRMEEQHIRSYLQIQEARYSDIMDYRIDIDPALYSYQIPKLTLQPIVENALYHGIKYKRSHGTITVNGRMQEEQICLIVMDDGAGMDEAELTQLREDISKPCKETDRGFGLANVNERIRMYFGAEYGLTIDSAKGEGTKVTIVIPAILEEQNLLAEGGVRCEQET